MAADEVVLIVDEKGRRYLARIGDDQMTKVSGLGTIRSDQLREALNGGEMTVGERKMTVCAASLGDILSMIKRKAQIITPKDIAVIVHHCSLRYGSRVVEGGAGSGALTIALLSAVGNDGKVWTYEINDEFASIAAKNVRGAGLDDRWTVVHADICAGISEEKVDAVILDIPNPWDCVEAAFCSLRLGGSFCAFVPTANQVENTYRALVSGGFSDVRAVETLQRDMVVHDRGIRPSFDMLGHTGYLVFARKMKPRDK